MNPKDADGIRDGIVRWFVPGAQPEAPYLLLSDPLGKTTVHILSVDGRLAEAFQR